MYYFYPINSMNIWGIRYNFLGLRGSRAQGLKGSGVQGFRGKLLQEILINIIYHNY
jgi:hypothetical protein